MCGWKGNDRGRLNDTGGDAGGDEGGDEWGGVIE